jgi:hypothetical protein
VSQLHNLKIFGRNFALKDYCPVDDPQLQFDYLTLDSVSVVVPKQLDADRDDYATVDGFDGVIRSVKLDEGSTVLTIAPLLSLFDVALYYPKPDLAETAIEDYFKAVINAHFVNNADTVQNIPGLTVAARTGTLGAINADPFVNNLYELAVEALNKYNIVIDLSLNAQTKKVNCVIAANQTPVKYIKADLPNIIEQTFTLRDEYGKCNKFTAVDGSGLEQPYTIYADGYEAPCVPATEYIDGNTPEVFKKGTEYKKLYFPTRPRMPEKAFEAGALFGDVALAVINNTTLISQPVIQLTHGANYYVYVWRACTLSGITFTGEGWYSMAVSTATPISGNPWPDGLLVESAASGVTNIELLNRYVSTQPSEFYTKAAERAAAIFQSAEFNNLIELTVKKTDGLVHDIAIGQTVNIIKNGTTYPATLTAWESSGDLIKYIFGAVRIDLTKQLKLEKRAGK